MIPDVSLSFLNGLNEIEAEHQKYWASRGPAGGGKSQANSSVNCFLCSNSVIFISGRHRVKKKTCENITHSHTNTDINLLHVKEVKVWVCYKKNSDNITDTHLPNGDL